MRISTKRTKRLANGGLQFTTVTTLTAADVAALRRSVVYDELDRTRDRLARVITATLEFQLADDMEGRFGGF